MNSMPAMSICSRWRNRSYRSMSAAGTSSRSAKSEASPSMAQRSASVRQASAGHSSKPSLVSDVMAYWNVPSTNSQRVMNGSAASMYCCSSVM